MPKPVRLIVTHARSTAGQDLFTVTPTGRSAVFAANAVTNAGHTLVGQFPRFDFTISGWGLSLSAQLEPSTLAARALSGATPKTSKPRAPRAASAPRFGRRGRAAAAWAASAVSGPAFTAPKPSRRDMLLVAMASLEDGFAVKLSESGIDDAARKSYDRYSKLKALGLGPTTNSASATEAYAALRMAVIELVKLAF